MHCNDCRNQCYCGPAMTEVLSQGYKKKKKVLMQQSPKRFLQNMVLPVNLNLGLMPCRDSSNHRRRWHAMFKFVHWHRVFIRVCVCKSLDKVTKLVAELYRHWADSAPVLEPYERWKGQQEGGELSVVHSGEWMQGVSWGYGEEQKRSFQDVPRLYLTPTWTQTHCRRGGMWRSLQDDALKFL